MTNTVSRRHFVKSAAIGLAGAAIPALTAQKTASLKIGCSTLAWNVSSSSVESFEAALTDISGLGYWGFETVSQMLEAFDADGTMSRLIDKFQIPLRAGYLGTNVTDPSLRKENTATAVRVGKLIRKYGGTYAVVAVNRRAPVPGQAGGAYDFREHRSNIVASLNEYGMALNDLGLGVGIHPHTGTVIETKDEVYGLLEAVNTKYMKFAPDVGQLQKAGADAAKVVKDFARITTHMHLKDYSGGKYMGGYCPLGMGVVDLVSILNAMEEAGNNPDGIHELDRKADTPMTARETAVFSRSYLVTLEYKFRS